LCAAGWAGATPPPAVAANHLRSRSKQTRASLRWEPWGPEAFATARREHKPVLLDGAAAWCHWCHVMDDTTYADPDIARIVQDRFIPVRFDVDEHPELEDRYGAWGWPATILLSPEGDELGKYRGYLPPDELRRILESLTLARPDSGPGAGFDDFAPGVDGLTYVSALAAHTLDSFYDTENGGWGMRRKVPISANAEFELRRAAHADAAALKRAVFSLESQRALIDPLWGGLSQYSAARDWGSPHFEKLMTYQAPAIEAYARAALATHDARLLADARHIAAYVERFLTAPDGTFYVSQDADLGAHDGHAYYAHDEAGRLALGVPHVDTHVYAYENGLALSAFCTLWEASGDHGVLERAQRAADVLRVSHVTEEGLVKHEASSRGPFFLADAAALGRGLTRLATVTHEARYREAAERVGRAMVKSFRDEATGAFWDQTVDPDAVGVFATRRRSFVHAVEAARFLAELAQLTGDPAWTRPARGALAAVATPSGLDEQGPWLGAFLLALDELGALHWPSSG
jgi:uncharacterized protein YyaL (SSP411 family)